MAINKKLIHFNSKENFDNKVASNEILDTSIVFIKDSKEIYTHGNLYKSVNWSVLEKMPTIITVPGAVIQTIPDSGIIDFSDSYAVRVGSIGNIKVKYADPLNLINENTVVFMILNSDGYYGGLPMPLSVIIENFPNSVDYEKNEIDLSELMSMQASEDADTMISVCLGYQAEDESLD